MWFKRKSTAPAVTPQDLRDIEVFNMLRQQVSNRDEIIKSLVTERNELQVQVNNLTAAFEVHKGTIISDWCAERARITNEKRWGHRAPKLVASR